jgi:hypothetical protein
MTCRVYTYTVHHTIQLTTSPDARRKRRDQKWRSKRAVGGNTYTPLYYLYTPMLGHRP